VLKKFPNVKLYASVCSSSRITACGQMERKTETDRKADREKERQTDRTKLPVYRNCKIATLSSVFFLS